MLIIFDLDDTLIHEGFEEFTERSFICQSTLKVLEYLKRNHQLAIASHNLEAAALAKRAGILHYFDIIVGEDPPCNTKRPLIDLILERVGKEKTDIMMFDDYPAVVKDLEDYGIQCQLVDFRTGVTMEDVSKAGL